MEIASFLIGFVALVIGLWHLYEIHSQAKDIRGQAEDLRSQAALSQSHKEILDSIQRALTTRHIGKFPEYMKTIADLVDKSNKDVTILCDFPAYGRFSAPHDFLAYRHALERKIEGGKSVRITTLESSFRVALTHEQFSLEEKDWDKWKATSKNQDRLTTFLNSHGGTTVDDLTVERFADLLEEEDRRMLGRSFKGAAISEIKAYVPVYFWLIDGSDAVFSIPSFTEKATEHGFYTSDPHLIAGLQDLEGRYRNRKPTE